MRSPFWRYLIAVIVTAVAIALSNGFAELLAPMRLFFLWAAVLIAAVVGGVGPALLAIVLSLAAAFLLLDISTPADALRLALFALFAGGISLAVGLRRRAEERAARLASELRKSELRYRTVVETAPMPQAFWTATPEGKVRFSDQWLAITGQARADIERTGGMSIIHKDDSSRTSGRWRAATLHQTLYEDEIRVRVADGSYRWFAIKGVPVRDERGTILEWAGVIADIHERKRQEREAEFINRASEVLTSSLQQEETLRNLARLCVPALGEWCAIDLARENATYERVVAEPQGEADRDADENRIVAPMIARGRVLGMLIVAGSQSTEEDARLIEELARRAAMAIDNSSLYEAAEAANRAKDEFLATLSHELRTPLTSIAGWAHMLQLGIADDETQRLAVDTIIRSAKAQGELIDDLLDLSRVVAGTLHLNVVTINLSALVEDVVVAVRPAADAKGLTLQQERDDEPLLVRGDERRLRQIVWNLLSNAVKFTSTAGSVWVSLSRRDGNACVEVADTGRGIEPSFLPHVWDRFRQADSSTSRQYGGLGLGLSVVRHLVELHGGTVHAHSEGAGRGATFTFEIPLARAEQQVDVRAVVPRTSPLQGKRILVVDDDADARIVIGAMLRQAGGEITAADSVQSALRALRGDSFDVVVTDIAMPHEDGFTLLRRVRESSDVPVVAVSAIATGGDDRVNALQAGFAEFVRKPVEPQQIASVVASVV